MALGADPERAWLHFAATAGTRKRILRGTQPASHQERPPLPPEVSAIIPPRALCERTHLSVSAVQQDNTNNRMALQFVQDLDRCTFECRFAQFNREATSILFLNATLRDQGRYSNRS